MFVGFATIFGRREMRATIKPDGSLALPSLGDSRAEHVKA
jgi:hypothetical protein